MKKLLTALVLLGMIVSLQVSSIGAQEPDPTDTLEPTTYEVVEGDTAESIAQAFGISVEDLLAANELSSPEEIEVGMILVIPPAAEPTEEATEEPAAQPTEEVTEEPAAQPTEEVTEEPAAQPTEEVTEEPAAQPTEEVTEEPAAQPTEEATEEPTEEATEEPTAVPTEETTESPPAVRDESSVGEESSDEDVGAAGAQPGNFTTTRIGIANLESSGSPSDVVLTLYNLDSSATANPTVPSVYPGGVSFVTDSALSTGRYSGVIQASVAMAAAALTVNTSARTADMYTGFSEPATTLYGPLIFNKHSNWETTLYCQNAGVASATINAALFKTGESSPRITLSRSVAANKTVIWDIADMSNVQAAWPGGAGQYGFVRFTSANNIACVVDNQRMVSPYVQSQYSAAPSSSAGTVLFVPLVFHGHGSSSANLKSLKWNSGVSIVNTNASAANVQVVYKSGSYTKTCTKTVPANGSTNWYSPEVGTGPDGWSCTPSGPLAWSYPGGPTFGSAKLTSNIPVLAISNANRYDSGASLGAGYSSIGVAPSGATNKLACPLAFNKNVTNNWVTGIRVVNVGSGTASVTWRMVRSNVNPTVSGNFATFTKSVPPGAGESLYFPEWAGALTNFEGAVFVSATPASAKIAATSSNTNYFGVGAGAMYDCVNY